MTLDFFLSDATFQKLIENLVSSFSQQVDRTLRDATANFSSFDLLLDLIETVIKHPRRLPLPEEIAVTLFPEVFILAYLLSRCSGSGGCPSVVVARGIWMMWVKEGSADLQARVLSEITLKLRTLLADTGIRFR